MTLDDYLRETRRKQEDFAREIGVSQAAVTRYANGHRIPRASVMARIAQATDGRVSASDFYPAVLRSHSETAPSLVSQSDAETSACPTEKRPRAAQNPSQATR